MAVASDARLDWDAFSYDVPWPCADGCHQYYLFNDYGAHVDHDRTFTHVHDDQEILDYNYASLKSEILRAPNLTYKDFVFRVWTDNIVDQMIIGTNEYGHEHSYDDYEEIELDDVGRCRMRLVIATYILQKEHNLSANELFQNKEHKAKFLTNHMSRKWWRSVRHNLCFNEWGYLINTDAHKCTDKFDYTLQELVKNSNSLIVMPKRSVLDETRTVDNSRRSSFGTFIQNKPIKRGRTTDAVCCKLRTRNGHLLDGLSIALNTYKGKKDNYDETLGTLLDPAKKEGKTDNKVHQIIKTEHENDVLLPNAIVSLDKGYNSINVLEKVLKHYGVKGVGPVSARRKCLPKFFSTARFKKLKKKLRKGQYKQWYTRRGLHLTLFHDSKFVNMFDTCIDQDKLAVIQRRRKKKERKRSRRWRVNYTVPKVIEYYNKTMGSVDASNARRKNHMIGNKHVRKHNRCYLGLFGQVVLQNPALMYGAYKGWKKVSQKPLLLAYDRIQQAD